MRPAAEKPARKLLRCAVYTRKSTEHNLDLEFNSLDAQREACEAYIKSQAHEGWRLIPDRYDDGAFSGASLERPALQSLLAEVKAGKIDVIVVYKVDRLTRALADFAKLVELFDQHSVSFVSVTQSFNTTSSMGRLTLNVLLSFAQFEREVIGERVRDKIAASKAKGIWVGGAFPLGYASVNKKLVVVPEKAETIRFIFRRYLEVGSIRDLADDLHRRKIRTRQQILSTGKIRGGIRFGVGTLAYLLRNRFFIGEVVYRGAIHEGEHTPLLDRSLFDAVQAKLASGAVARQLKLKSSPSILAGRIFDDHGNRMTPTHTNKQGARYRYYTSHFSLQKRTLGSKAPRVNAQDIESMVIKALRGHLAKHHPDKSAIPASDRDLIERHLERLVVKRQTVEIRLIKREGATEQPSPTGPSTNCAGAKVPDITLSWAMPSATAVKGVNHTPSAGRTVTSGDREALLTAIAKARNWIQDLVEGRATSFADIAAREGKVERHIRLLAPLAFVSPKIITGIADSDAFPHSITDLAKTMPVSWRQQALDLATTQP